MESSETIEILSRLDHLDEKLDMLISNRTKRARTTNNLDPKFKKIKEEIGEETISVDQLASMIGKSYGFVYQQVNKKNFPHTRVGSGKASIRFTLKDVEQIKNIIDEQTIAIPRINK